MAKKLYSVLFCNQLPPSQQDLKCTFIYFMHKVRQFVLAVLNGNLLVLYLLLSMEIDWWIFFLVALGAVRKPVLNDFILYWLCWYFEKFKYIIILFLVWLTISFMLNCCRTFFFYTLLTSDWNLMMK